MSARSVLTLLRLPFGLFLLPISLFAVVAVVGQGVDPLRLVLTLVALHLCIYPASNGYNSWCDRDTTPIGGVEYPPLPTRGLWWASLVLDVLGIGIGLAVGPVLGGGLLAYSLFSRAYSSHLTRWKRYPRFSLLGITLVQGSLVFALVAWHVAARPAFPTWLGAGPPPDLEDAEDLLALLARPELAAGACLAALFLAAIYPLTQIYQHEADAEHGDRTWSMLVGVRGTFVSSSIFLALTGVGFLAWFALFMPPARLGLDLLVLAVCLGPAVTVFSAWWRATWRDAAQANYAWMLRMNLVASIGMNVCMGIQCLTNALP